MRNLVLILVFINILYFFWSVTTKEPVIEQQQPTNIETLQLFTGSPKVSTPKKVVVAPVEPTFVPEKKPVNEYCVEIIDYKDQHAAQQGMQALLASSKDIQKDTRIIMRPKIIEDYWVIYPAGKDWEESKANTHMIQSKGITDLWLVPDGENKGIISLGLYATEEQALLSVARFKEKGLEARLVKRQKEQKRYLILLKSNNGNDVLEGQIKSTLNRLNLYINKISCLIVAP